MLKTVCQKFCASSTLASALFVCITAFDTCSISATAGSVSEFTSHGFTKNSEFFVYEIYGYFDGEGGVYSSIYILDTNVDILVRNTPIHELVGDGDPGIDTITLGEVRRRSLAKAAPALVELGELEQGVTLVSQPLGEIGVSPHYIRFGHPIFGSLKSPPWQASAEFDLLLRSEIAKPNTDCAADLGELHLKFSLESNGKTVYMDNNIPESRGCPNEYMISEVIWGGVDDLHIAVISYFENGFEGLDRKFVAVPFRTVKR